MTHRDEKQLFDLIKENNRMLKFICQYIWYHGNHTDDAKEFGMNVAANILSNNFNR
jgi:hypothetical protein